MYSRIQHTCVFKFLNKYLTLLMALTPYSAKNDVSKRTLIPHGAYRFIFFHLARFSLDLIILRVF